MIYVGIDLHTTNMVIVAINGNGEVVQEAKIPTSTEALAKFFGKFDLPVKAVVECTSSWYWLSDWCRSHDIPLKLAHAKMVKAISYAKVKTDKVDARTLAELLRADLIPEAWQVKADRRDLRELTRGRLRMIQRRGKLQASLWSQAATYNVHISKTRWRYPGKLQQWLGRQLPSAARLEARLMLAQIVQLQQHIHRIEQEIEQYSGFTKQVQRLVEIPGVGESRRLDDYGRDWRYFPVHQRQTVRQLLPAGAGGQR